MDHVEVAVAAPLQTTLTYLYEQAQRENCRSAESLVGCRVLVPLSGRLVTGYVLGITVPQETSFRLKNIHEILDLHPLFHADAIPFFQWIANYYHHPIGEVISTALPAGLSRPARKIIKLIASPGAVADMKATYREPLPGWFEELLIKKKLSPAESQAILKNNKYRPVLAKLASDGIVNIDYEIVGAIGEKKEICYEADGLVVEKVSLDGHPSKQQVEQLRKRLNDRLNDNFKFAEAKAVYYFASLHKNGQGAVPQKEILKKYKSAGPSLKSLSTRGILQKVQQRVYRNPFGEIICQKKNVVQLTPEQQQVTGSIFSAIQSRNYTVFLLHGVTGSGKTEVYLRAAEQCLQQGRNVLVLVPEIALATQLETQFVAWFGDRIALLHSGLSGGEKFDQWSLVARGLRQVVIGARSAVFAPMTNIGLIIVDEEHDSGFKQDDGLRYNGRDLAVLRGKMNSSVVILGSATPSVSSYYHATQGKYTLLNMRGRAGGSSLPNVEIVDLRSKSSTKTVPLFHQRFIAELKTNLESGEQSLVLINRRGFSISLLCQECGNPVQCKHCNVALTFHKNRQRLLCHYCDYGVTSSIVCENCQSDKLVPLGYGTERVQEELQNQFPEATIKRLDSDSATDRKKFISLLQEMHNGDIDILIGTQMIAKGHHFPNVTFVGVVWADGGLNMPDFRAAERTYQLLSQVTGRAGRGSKPGRVIIQTMRPGHYAIRLAENHEFTEFYEREVSLRKRPAFPPYVRLICFKAAGENEFEVKKTLERVSQACKTVAVKHGFKIEYLGPASSPLDKIKNKYRWQLLLKSGDTAALHQICKYIMGNGKTLAMGRVVVQCDVDPENMM